MPPNRNPPGDLNPPTIDGLLARYILLLDQYTALRTTLSAHSSSLFLGLARARFSAQRGAGAGGHPFGPDNYDMRMQAGRRVRIRSATASVAKRDGEDGFVLEVIDGREVSGSPSGGETSAGADARRDDGEHPPDEQPQDDGEDTKPAGKLKSNDPLRWFGILTPAPLREAQKEAVKMVEDVIPRLASLDAEMAAIELAVRRARKKRGKAGAAAARKAEVEQQRVEVVAGEGALPWDVERSNVLLAGG